MTIREPDRDKSWMGRNLRWVIMLLGVIGILLAARMAVSAPFDPTTDTPLGTFKPNDDITEAVQWAVDHQHEFQQKIVIPGGRWEISKTIEMPYRIGSALLGVGVTHPPIINAKSQGLGTVLCWRGEPGGTMIRYTGTAGEIGDMTLLGVSLDQKRDGPRAGVGLLVDNPPEKQGIGTGFAIIRPLWVESCDYAVQLAANRRTSNCDNVIFEKLRAHWCKAAYRSCGEQVLDITIQHLLFYHCDYGCLIENGGGLHVQRSMVGPNVKAMLRLPGVEPGSKPSWEGTGKYNGHLRFSNTKVDARVGTEWCYVDSDNPQQIQITFDGEMYGEDKAKGVQARICGQNILLFDHHANTFDRIIGTKTKNWDGADLIPAVTIRDCRVWGGGPVFEGDLRVRMSGCYNAKNEPLPELPAPPEPDLSGRKFHGVIE